MARRGWILRPCERPSRGQVSNQLHLMIAGTGEGKVGREGVLSDGSAGEVHLATVEEDPALAAGQTPEENHLMLKAAGLGTGFAKTEMGEGCQTEFECHSTLGRR